MVVPPEKNLEEKVVHELQQAATADGRGYARAEKRGERAPRPTMNSGTVSKDGGMWWW